MNTFTCGYIAVIGLAVLAATLRPAVRDVALTVAAVMIVLPAVAIVAILFMLGNSHI